MRPSLLCAKLSRQLCKKSNSVKGKVGVISEIFCIFTTIYFKFSPDSARDGSFGGFYVKVQIIYYTDKQLVKKILNIPTLFTLLVVISSCKAQGNNNIKQNKTSERTTEKFDSWTYYTQRQGSEYVFEDYLRGKVRQFGGNNGSNQGYSEFS